jgi:hypothetical protein
MERRQKLIWIAFASFFLVLSPWAQGGAHKESRRRPPEAAGFPAYPKRPAPSAAGAHRAVPVRPDSLGNRVTEDHLTRVEFAHGRTDQVMKKDLRITEVVRGGRAGYMNNFRHEFEHRSPGIDVVLHRYNTILIEHPQIVNIWHSHYFYGGFYYGFHPILDIDVYFYNPVVYWFYARNADDYYYRNWYRAEYDAYPALHAPFEFPGLYYPTENLRQLLFGVSAMPVDRQVRFREAIALFTRRLAQNLANSFNTHVRLVNGDIVVTHYEILGYDEAVVLEGLVSFNGGGYHFKGLLDLQTPAQTNVFAPVALDVEPSAAQIQSLDELNARIAQLKGEPAPGPVPATNAPNTPPPAAEVNADPQPR